jgi:glucoside 3-dehydrogenase (cytochrome c) hitch-hiker subunit
MRRRELLQLLGSSALLPFVPRSTEAALGFGRAVHRVARGRTLEILTPAQAELVTVVADLILPRTDTPAASDVGVTGFIDHLLAAWYHADEREPFLAGLAELDRRAGSRFASLPPDRQLALLTELDGGKGEPGSAEATFARLKSLTVYGYFTSERVVQEVTREPIIPGRYDGCVSM